MFFFFFFGFRLHVYTWALNIAPDTKGEALGGPHAAEMLSRKSKIKSKREKAAPSLSVSRHAFRIRGTWNVARCLYPLLATAAPPSRGPHESIIVSFEKLPPPFPLRTVKRRFLAARVRTRFECARSHVMPRAKS